MNKGVIITIVVIAVLLLASLFSYNGLVSSREEVREKESVIDVQLKRRADLIGNLVESVKGYMEHETEIITVVSESRAKLAGAKTVSEKAAANDETVAALSGFLAISESYPEIKTDANFRQLSDELAGTENRISTARIDYNKAASTYNKKIITLPGSLFAGQMGLERVEYFEATEVEREAPKVQF